jgi:hypothetical protein
MLRHLISAIEAALNQRLPKRTVGFLWGHSSGDESACFESGPCISKRDKIPTEARKITIGAFLFALEFGQTKDPEIA